MQEERLRQELTRALRHGDERRLSVLRMLAASIHNREIEKRGRAPGEPAGLDDEERTAVIRSELKKRRDAIEAYTRAGRSDRAAAEQAEAEILESFLPPELSDQELTRLVSDGARELGAQSPQDFGKLMAWVMARAKGAFGGERAARAVRAQLAGS